MSDLPANTPRKPRRTAQDRLLRRQRILDGLREGRSFAEIAEAEGLSRERIRQIVAETLERREIDAQREFAQVQMLRLAPALRLAAQGVAEGELKAIGELIRVLDRLDKYQAVARVIDDDYKGAREKLLNKLDTMARRMGLGPRLEAAAARMEAEQKERAAANAAGGAQQAANAHPWGLKP